MRDVIRVEDRFYILSTSSRVDDRTRILADGRAFAVFDRYGDVHRLGRLGEQGLYRDGTRFLSAFELSFASERALLLSSAVRDDNTALAVDLANPDLPGDAGLAIPADTIHLHRSLFLWDGCLYQAVRVRSFALQDAQVSLRLAFAADFADIFEVRGVQRKQRGRPAAAVPAPDCVELAYEGLDGVTRRTRLLFDPAPARLDAGAAEWVLRLPPRGELTLRTRIVTVLGDETRPAPPTHDDAWARAHASRRRSLEQDARVSTSNPQLDAWLGRSAADLHMMLARTPHGVYPLAGIPWYGTLFGRDSLVTAWQTLWLSPTLARGVLCSLAALQAHEVSEERQAEPGKIVHEMRGGEMAALGEIPFGRYYGTVDATPLFVVLAGAYFERTGDRATIERLWPNVEAALQWMSTSGDADGDGFLEYRSHGRRGLINQGWKDSADAVFHADGELAEGPIALAEVQAYAYAAWLAGARLARVRGDERRAAELLARAESLRTRFEEAFWSEELSTYVLALDGAKRQCRVKTSNAGQVLFSGIASPERARRVADALLADDAFSGWGVRTVARGESRYNPMSYHNGSVWPHDNALIALGLARNGCHEHAMKIFSALFDAASWVELQRLPELFCGFVRRQGEGPTLYPVACSPQAWATGAVFQLLQAALGLSFDASARQLVVAQPMLPPFVEQVRISHLRVGDACVDVLLTGHGRDVSVETQHHRGRLDVVMRA
ncbi:MAG: glycogen debranching N-terminal domain-containing protein [Thermodesulfobacteriota bacterium]